MWLLYGAKSAFAGGHLPSSALVEKAGLPWPSSVSQAFRVKTARCTQAYLPSTKQPSVAINGQAGVI
ncbi:MAG: hypothetical protein EBV34_19130 [Betaproteobacteria bacterium]|nr:hypothetical protein [Betaproteobacteria bacterium]